MVRNTEVALIRQHGSYLIATTTLAVVRVSQLGVESLSGPPHLGLGANLSSQSALEGASAIRSLERHQRRKSANSLPGGEPC